MALSRYVCWYAWPWQGRVDFAACVECGQQLEPGEVDSERYRQFTKCLRAETRRNTKRRAQERVEAKRAERETPPTPQSPPVE